MNKFYKNKIILVTGGCGSIGREIVKKLIEYEPKSVRILDNNETGLFDLQKELNTRKIRPLVGDVRDSKRLKKAVEGVDIVFHAAALKHVPLCEYNPFEAVKTNIIGTENLIDACLEEEVEKVIFISTDKAVNPTNVMGATKLLAERFTVSSNYFKGLKKTALSCVRFGNVLNSRGSVIPLFEKQIKNGGPVTVTNPEMTRFIMDIPHAVELVLRTAEIAKGGEIFILKMPAIKIGDLAEASIEYYAPKYGYDLYIVTGSSFVKHVLKEKNYDAALLVACDYELNKVMMGLKGKNIVTYGIPMLNDGCFNTKVDYDKVIETLEMLSSDLEIS